MRSAADQNGTDPGVPRASLLVRASRRIRASVIGLTIALVVALVIGFAWFLTRVPTTEPVVAERAEGIVVLTGGASRISDAVELLAAGHGKRLLITGVNPATGPRGIARNLPEHRRIFACCVDLDRSALNTFGNATETRRWARKHGFRSLIVVTSAYHMPRAMAELGHQLPEVNLIAFPVITEKMRQEQWWNSPTASKLLVSEFVKYVAAQLRMRISPHAAATAASRYSGFASDGPAKY